MMIENLQVYKNLCDIVKVKKPIFQVNVATISGFFYSTFFTRFQN